MTTADFEELLKVLDVTQVDDDTFTGGHPSRNPVRTFGGQMMAQAFVAASRTVPPKLPPTTLSTHFIAGGDPERDLEFKVVRLRDERRFANRRVDDRQAGVEVVVPRKDINRIHPACADAPCVYHRGRL